jgi:hypothetical protein
LDKYGEPIIFDKGKGGYYDGREEEFPNESYWVDPLAGKKVGKGEVGTYKYTEKNTLMGDFRWKEQSKYWYDTPKSDPNNSESEGLYFREKNLTSDYEEFRTFKKLAIRGTALYIPEGPLFVVEKDMITCWTWRILFSIAYS